jgi:hypothetical protein
LHEWEQHPYRYNGKNNGKKDTYKIPGYGRFVMAEITENP